MAQLQRLVQTENEGPRSKQSQDSSISVFLLRLSFYIFKKHSRLLACTSQISISYHETYPSLQAASWRPGLPKKLSWRLQ